MNYYLDTEFIEGTQKEGFPISLFRKESVKTIDLISIGVVSEDGREYYAVSKDFNLREAWDRYQMKQVSGDARNRYPEGVKEYWIRDNVLNPIFDELLAKYTEEYRKALRMGICIGTIMNETFSYKLLKFLIGRYGKTNKQIANEIQDFVYQDHFNRHFFDYNLKEQHQVLAYKDESAIKFYGYYADYDWVAFCWLFGRMIDLPKGFPMYCIDLKQILDDLAVKNMQRAKGLSFDRSLDFIKTSARYPEQIGEHNALSDAKWNKELHTFLKEASKIIDL